MKRLFLFFVCLALASTVAAQNNRTGFRLDFEDFAIFHPGMDMLNEVKALSGNDYSSFMISEGVGLSYNSQHLMFRAGAWIGGMAHISAYKIAYGGDAFVGYTFNHKPSRPALTLGLNVGVEKNQCHFDVAKDVVLDMETHAVAGSGQSFVLSNRQFVVGPRISVEMFENHEIVLGYDFGLAPTEYEFSSGQVLNNRKAASHRIIIGGRVSAPLSK
ncbi:MAG: hypothetical protein IKO59_01420 [Bacteroidales bacterium]|nr:hypothetical protein [Bacteroidales bacterium]